MAQRRARIEQARDRTLGRSREPEAFLDRPRQGGPGADEVGWRVSPAVCRDREGQVLPDRDGSETRLANHLQRHSRLSVDDLGADFARPVALVAERQDPPSHAVARLQDRHGEPAADERRGAREPGRAGADHDDVGHGVDRRIPRQARTTGAAGDPAMTITGLRPLPAGATTAVRLAEMVGEMAAELGIRDDPGAVATEVLAVVRDPLGLYEDHPAWPCLLTDMGVPLELSLKVDAGRRTALRYVTDVTDHRAGLAANWTRYVGYGTTVTSAADAGEGEIWELCRLHLNGVPTAFRSRVMHGQGFAAPDRYRGSIYFRTGWLAHGQLLERFPTVMACLEDAHRRHGTPSVRRIEVLGYDFSPGEPMRTKAYVWPEFDRSDTFDVLLGRHPDLDPARSIFEDFRSDADAASGSSPALPAGQHRR